MKVFNLAWCRMVLDPSSQQRLILNIQTKSTLDVTLCNILIFHNLFKGPFHSTAKKNTTLKKAIIPLPIFPPGPSIPRFIPPWYNIPPRCPVNRNYLLALSRQDKICCQYTSMQKLAATVPTTATSPAFMGKVVDRHCDTDPILPSLCDMVAVMFSSENDYSLLQDQKFNPLVPRAQK